MLPVRRAAQNVRIVVGLDRAPRLAARGRLVWERAREEAALDLRSDRPLL